MTFKKSKLNLWYDKPAYEWVEALPVGNGRLGAMVFGGIEREKLQINEDTIWQGKPHDYSHQGAAQYLPVIRTLLFEGKQKQAEELAMKEFMSIPLHQMSYQPFCDLLLDFPDHKNNQVTNYNRKLNLEKALVEISYSFNGINYTRQVFSSTPAQAIVMHIKADKAGKVNLNCSLDSPHSNYILKTIEEQLVLKGKVNKGVIEFEGRVFFNCNGGEVYFTDQVVKIKNANTVTLMFVGASNFNNYHDVSGNPTLRCQKYIEPLIEKKYEQLKQIHIKDYQQYFKRVEFVLPDRGNENIVTNQRIKQFTKKDDPYLAVLYYQFGRYLMISGSRPDCQPLNLQGIWNKDLDPAWGSKYTTVRYVSN